MQEYAVKNAVENVLASAAKSNKNYVQGHEADIKDVSTKYFGSCKGHGKIRC